MGLLDPQSVGEKAQTEAHCVARKMLANMGCAETLVSHVVGLLTKKILALHTVTSKGANSTSGKKWVPDSGATRWGTAERVASTARTMTLEVSQLSSCLELLQDRRKERGEPCVQKLRGRNSTQPLRKA
ncbi:hypothetical protein HJG60_011128 [Phyllostomus discolor]|uniref:Uncharacterized protein n=1 Tax=Phyllostomus discolor TaxID=89673 RepID=A0A834A1Z5_9CHIR|nr:hypothetical protein HJG60_011128 [Phyllostomus discolor]